MRQTLPLAWVIALVIMAGDRLASAQSSTNDPAALVLEANTCARRLHEVYGEAARIDDKTPPDQPELIDCIHSRVLKIKGLLELTEIAQKDIQKALKRDETNAIGEYASNVKICCARAEKLLVEAQGCSTSVALQAAPTNAPPAVVTNASTNVNIKITPRTTVPLAMRHPVVRTDQTCLHHEQFAGILARAMDLKLVEKATPDEFIKALARLAVEPLGGWQLGRCVTVDDVYVACARAMNLKVKNSQDPLSYGQALRDEGLGVDTLLPERDPKLDPPYVVDSEVREFLATGYAAPLPSSRRLAPD